MIITREAMVVKIDWVDPKSGSAEQCSVASLFSKDAYLKQETCLLVLLCTNIS